MTAGNGWNDADQTRAGKRSWPTIRLARIFWLLLLMGPPADPPGREIARRIDKLAAFSDTPDGLTRLYLGTAHRQAVDVLAGWMRAAGMRARLDAIGNVVGRYEGEVPDAPALLLGSHIDTVHNAGRFDGPLGVITAIEVVRRMALSERRLPFAIEVIAFGDEEGVRFPSTLSGSRALAGVFDPECLDERDKHGISRRDALMAFGCDVTQIAREARSPPRTVAYVEVHIEQGPVLEQTQHAVGVVTGIVGATRGSVEIRGRGGHAGGVPMRLRRDALNAAAEMLLAIESRARQDEELVATVGQLEVPQGAPNTIPGLARFTLDIRAPSDELRRQALSDISERVRLIAQARQVEAAISLSHDAPAALCDPRLCDLLAASVERCRMTPFRLPSGAGHDAMAFRGRLPMAMLFVRCKGGVSHNPAEYASAEDIDVAARILADFVDTLNPRHLEAAHDS
jgi:allantoate deiminase